MVRALALPLIGGRFEAGQQLVQGDLIAHVHEHVADGTVDGGARTMCSILIASTTSTG